MRITKLDPARYGSLVRGAKLIRGHEHAPVLMHSPSGELLKFFRRRKRISSNRLFPYASRFVRNGAILRELGFRAPAATGLYYYAPLFSHIVSYPPLPGRNVQQLFDDGDEGPLAGLPAYLAQLHEAGVFFHSLHLENVLYDAEAGYALVDIANLKRLRGPLSPWVRGRNLAHLFLHPVASTRLARFGERRFMALYHEAAGLPERRGDWLDRYLARRVPALRG